MRTRTLKSMCALCVFAVVAIAAQVASAQTAYECAPTTSGAGFSDAHCKEAVASGAAFHHVVVPVNTREFISWTNITTGTSRSTLKLKNTTSGITLELQAAEVSGAGHLENKTVGGETRTEGTAILKLEGVTVTMPIGHGCEVKGSTGVVGYLPTEELLLTNKGLTNEWKLAEISPAPFVKFAVQGCNISALNHAYTVTGSIKGKAGGTTLAFTHATGTSEVTLFDMGQTAGLDGSLTLKRSSTGNGIALT